MQSHSFLNYRISLFSLVFILTKSTVYEKLLEIMLFPALFKARPSPKQERSFSV